MHRQTLPAKATVADTQPVQPRLQILVVEDNALIAMHFEDILVQLGSSVILAAQIPAGLHLIDTQHLDGAFLDIDTGDDSILPIAERLAALAIPCAIVTRRAGSVVPVGFRHLPVLSKPVADARFADVVATFAATRPH